jgi:hypothetical protein
MRVKMPNWFVHIDWAKEAGIPEAIANFVNTRIDYGINWSLNHETGDRNRREFESTIYMQLKFFYEKDKESMLYVKACYLHHLLDFFKETYVDIHDIELVFSRFLLHKVIDEITSENLEIISFKKEINDIFQLLRENKQKLYDDLKGPYLLNLEKTTNSNKKIFGD